MLKKNGYLIVIVIFVLWLLYNFYHGYNYNKELKESGIVTVGMITEFKGAAKGPYLNFLIFYRWEFKFF